MANDKEKSNSKNGELEQLRKKIDQVDQELLSLFSERWSHVLRICEVKKQHHLPVLDSQREERIINRLVDQGKDKMNPGLIQSLFQDVIYNFRTFEDEKYKEQSSSDSEVSNRLSNIRIMTIVGMGLMGGSLAKAVQCHLPHIKVKGYDINTKEWRQSFDAVELSQVFESDVIVLSLPIQSNIDFLRDHILSIKKETLVLDLGSTKEKIHRFLESQDSLRFQFVGGHPLCGKEKGGYLLSESHLFENKKFLISPIKNTTERSLQVVTEFISSIGGVVEKVDCEEHDKYLAITSHLSQLVSTALCLNAEKYLDSIKPFVTPTFLKMTRVAESPYNVWKDILESNQENITENLISLSNVLLELSQKIGSDMLSKDFLKAKSFRKEIYKSNKKEKSQER